MTTPIDAPRQLRTAIERLRTENLMNAETSAALVDWLTNAAHFWTDVSPVERTHAYTVARAINGGEQR